MPLGDQIKEIAPYVRTTSELQSNTSTMAGLKILWQKKCLPKNQIRSKRPYLLYVQALLYTFM